MSYEVGSSSPFGVSLVGNTVVVDGRLEITFRRTIKVPDNGQTSDLPPDLGRMALTNVNAVAHRLPDAMAAKGGLLIAMHEDEAMWIKFRLQGDTGYLSDRHRNYAVKMFAGGINVVSGEPEHETTASTLRRRNLLAKGESVQDYVVVPGQQWIDGIAVSGGKVLQFVAKELGKGFTVEGQMTGEETIGGLQFEIITTKKKALTSSVPLLEGCIHVHVTGYKGRQSTIHNFNLDLDTPVLGDLIRDADHDVPEYGWAFGFKGGQTISDRRRPTLRDYGVQESDGEIHVEVYKSRDRTLSKSSGSSSHASKLIAAEYAAFQAEQRRAAQELAAMEERYRKEVEERRKALERMEQCKYKSAAEERESERRRQGHRDYARPITEERPGDIYVKLEMESDARIRDRVRERSKPEDPRRERQTEDPRREQRTEEREAQHNPELGIAAGGKIRQTIVADKLSDDDWDKENIVAFNVQILNAKDYVRITGLPAPSMPTSARSYAKSGGNFYKLEEEESSIHGDFEQVKSIAQLTGQFDEVLHINSKLIGQKSKAPSTSHGTFKPEASMMPTHAGLETTENSKYGHAENAGIAPLSVFENAEKLPVIQAEYEAFGVPAPTGTQPGLAGGYTQRGSIARNEGAIICKRTERRPFRTVRDLVSSLTRKRFTNFG
ncbi:hypothetical protein TWF696_002088 [Orbilia brochopaga]|uniref:Uncharacterized protein n=1 Tax=Orbilia brochopaga TaxID=3140254 RepID=A0AAV9U9P8_9PEZI